jgi:hypothetical protein
LLLNDHRAALVRSFLSALGFLDRGADSTRRALYAVAAIMLRVTLGIQRGSFSPQAGAEKSLDDFTEKEKSLFTI